MGEWEELLLEPGAVACEEPGGRLRLASGTRVGRLRVIGLLGCGWEASVYKVREPSTQRVKTLKCYRRKPGARRAVQRRARQLYRLEGSGGVPRLAAHCQVRYQGRRWPALLCDFRRGVSLEDLLAKQPAGALDSGQVLRLTRALARALGQLHERGAYHGDLHEGNTIVAPWGAGIRVHLVDPYPQPGRVSTIQRQDLVDCVRIMVRCFGPRRPYSELPNWVKHLARGQQAHRILQSTSTVTELLAKLDSVREPIKDRSFPALC